jgi:hypothetical protein
MAIKFIELPRVVHVKPAAFMGPENPIYLIGSQPDSSGSQAIGGALQYFVETPATQE